MQQDPPQSTRRQVIKTAGALLCCAGAIIAARTGSANASDSRMINQITDPTTTAAKDMFRFEPDFVRLAPGEELIFLNSRSQHTVNSVPELWPDGVPLVNIAHKDEASVRFDREGFYGFRCKRHGQYGMVMLVVVGEPGSAENMRSVIETMKAKKRERAGFIELFDRYERD